MTEYPMVPGNSSEIFTELKALPGRLGLLRRVPAYIRVTAIEQSIGVASDAESRVLGDELIRTIGGLVTGAKPAGRDARVLNAALAALAAAWARLTQNQRRSASELLADSGSRAEWRRVLRERATSQTPAMRRAVAEAIGDCPGCGAAVLLVTLLADPDSSVSDAAEGALRNLVNAALDSRERASADEELESVLADAARVFPDHRRRGVLESAALLLTPARWAGSHDLPAGIHRAEGPAEGTAVRPPSPLVRWFSGRSDETHFALRSVVRKSADPRMRARAWEWLGPRGDAVAAAALDRVARAASLEDHEALLPRTHLLANPVRARRASMIGNPAGRKPGGTAIPDVAMVPCLSVESRRGLPRLVAALHLTDEARAGALAPLLVDPDPIARYAAARMLPARGADGIDPWEASSEGSRLAARGLVRAERDHFLADLALRIASGQPRDQAGAVLLARRLGVTGDVEGDLLRALAAGPGDLALERLAATAAAALGDADSAAAREGLRACVMHPVPRVRANAVEGLGRIARRRAVHTGDLATADPEMYAAMLELKSDSQHRVRANALHALLACATADWTCEPAAEDALAAMLGDDRPPHRCAALWLADRLMARFGPGWHRWSHMATRVAEAARADTDPAVRVRAERCARRALAAVRTDWRERAAPLGSTNGGSP